MTTSWQPTTLVQCISVRPWLTYPGCDEPGGCHDLTLGRIYEMLGVEGQRVVLPHRRRLGRGLPLPGVALPSRLTSASERRARPVSRHVGSPRSRARMRPAPPPHGHLDRQPRHARYEVEPARSRRAGIQHEPRARARDQRPMRVPVHDHVGRIALEQLRRRRRPDLVAVAHVDRHAVDRDVDRPPTSRGWPGGSVLP